jgi:uncharacterized repeat protein (TIGR01451 family)
MKSLCREEAGAQAGGPESNAAPVSAAREGTVNRLWATLLAVVLFTGPASADDIRQISLATKDLIYDRFTRKIYASIPSSGGRIGNSVAAIDPFTGTVGPAIFVGSEPGALAVSDDGHYLYVGLDGAAAVRRVELRSQTADLQFPLGRDPFTGPYFAEAIEVLPGHPESIAISRRSLGFSPTHEGVAIYDDGVPRPAATPPHTGSNVIQVSPSGTRLYGYNNETTEFGLRRMSIDASGVSIIDVTENLISGFSVGMKLDAGRLYTTSGRVIDPEALLLLGTFAVEPYHNLVAPDARADRVFFLPREGTPRTLSAFDPQSFLPMGSIVIPGVAGTASSLIRWGTDGLAFRTDQNQVFFLRTSLLPSFAPAADLAITQQSTPDPFRVGEDLTYLLTVDNGGPDAATGVTVVDTLPGGATLVSVTVSQGSSTRSARDVTAALGTLARGARATVTIVVRPGSAVPLTNTALVKANELDPNPADNRTTQESSVMRAVGPDLTGSWAALIQRCGGAGASLRCFVSGLFQVRNVGDQQAAPSTLRVFLSRDAALDAGDLLLQGTELASIAPGRQQEVPMSAPLPAGSSASGQYLIVVLDAAEVVAESDEANNRIVFGPFR